VDGGDRIRVDRAWWSAYRNQLETAFGQEEIVLRAMPIEKP
jgi:hypothetical protein